MRFPLAALMLLIVLLPASALACRGEVTTVMDYLPGNWEVVDGQGNILGYSEIREGAGGCALRERWEGQDGLEGEALFTVSDGRWRLVWSDSDGLVLNLSGQPEDGNMVFTGTQSTEDGEILHRIAYELLFELGEIHQLWEYSMDGGRNWEVFFAAWYVREIEY
ncbi:hypothetical protein [Natronospira bacteriovora]|uniref:DUF1579 domain-containing protein n=1 Tax=Natronospira bacteriovora TaxID=3069753 RepID=A0ABU0W6L4_9GAMM|nr:hypothetical protein [Natronospira sp. AB-CW4]MDQ2069646.1 hypothetical protein [Natronospira sp. AB-CW4]